MTSANLIQDRNSQTPAGAALRGIDAVYSPPPLHWVGDGFRVAGFASVVPNAAHRLSPFLLLDYHPPYDYTPTSKKRGVGVHPHRGFETVTLAWQGSVAHHDSAGGGGVIGPGDVQWMTAASGILHKEYHEEVYAKSGGTFHMAQLWVNLPRAHKMTAPRYQALVAAQMGNVTLPEAAGEVRVIAGQFAGARGPAQTFSPIDLLDVRLNAGGHVDLQFAATDNTSVLVMSGAVAINERVVDAKASSRLVVMTNEAGRIRIKAQAASHVLIMNGAPINEAVAQYGPFVMNTEQEIGEAVEDFRAGKFGTLTD